MANDPHDPAAEAALLGACLVNSDAFRVCADLPASALYEPRLRRIWSALQHAAATGADANASGIIGSGYLPLGEGWAPLLQELIESAPIHGPAAAANYRRRVEVMARERELLAAAQGAIADLRSGLSSPDTIRSRLAAASAPHTDSTEQLPALSVPLLKAKAAGVVPWVWDGYLASGEVTLLAGREKLGKSTLLFALLTQVAHDGFFLERACHTTTTLYLTEEAPSTVVEKCDRFDLREGVHFVPRTEVHGLSFRTLCDQVLVTASHLRAGLVVFDTLAHWGGLGAEAENQAGAVQALFADLHRLTAAGLAVLVVHHLAKSSGEIRGSTALPGSADTVLKLFPTKGSRTGRSLFASGRHGETPQAIRLELDDSAYHLINGPTPTEEHPRSWASNSEG